MARTPGSIAWRAATSVAAPALGLLLHHRLRKGKEIAGRLHERRGIEHGTRPPGRLLWVHAASVGEVNAVLPVLSRLAEEERLSVLLTTATASSATLLQRRLPELGLDAVRHRMVPLDVTGWIERFLDVWRPDAAVFVESELWPNMLAALRERRIVAALINGRMSARSAGHWSQLPALASEMLGGFDVVWARSEQDAYRLRAFGARVAAVGDLKMAADPVAADPEELARLQALFGDRPRWLAASTHDGEEAVVADAHVRIAARFPGLLTIVAPRHPPRGASVAALLGGAPRRSLGEEPGAGFWISDTLGEMGLLCRLAPMVFVGRSLGPARGGQNLLEPARLGCCLATGPYTANFAETVAALEEASALTIVHGAGQLAGWLSRGLSDTAWAAEAGARAKHVATGPPALVDQAASLLRGMLAG